MTGRREGRTTAGAGRAASVLTALVAALAVLLASLATAEPAQAQDEPTPTPTPSVSPSLTPTGTPTDTPTPGTSPTGTPTASPTSSPTASPTATASPTPKPPVTGKIVGRVVDVRGAGVPRARVAVFDYNWNYIRDTKARRTGRFAFDGLLPGTYRLQVSDTRAAWRTDLFAPADANVKVRKRSTSVLAVTVRKGAFITGRVTRGPQDKGARRAVVRASDAFGRNYEVKADGQGYFALGGLKKGTFRVWAEDSGHRWAGKTMTVRGVSRQKPPHLAVRLRTRAGGINGFVLEGSQIAQHTTWVTAVHRRTGQWRVVKVRNGDLSLPGLLPGRYDFSLTATRTHAGRKIKSGTKVRAGRTKYVTLRLGKKLKK